MTRAVEYVSRSATATNSGLIGISGGRQQMLTPALVVDLGTLERNILDMQARCRAVGVTLRPHAKAHKCVEIARRQLQAGAVGICVATPGEAEVFARNGIPDILVTSVFSPGATVDLLADVARTCRLTLVLDRIETAQALAEAASVRSLVIPVLIDLDLGRHRSGLSKPEDLLALAVTVDRLKSLKLLGLQAYAGHLSHCIDFKARERGAEDVGRRIREATEIIRPFMNGADPFISGGSTGALLQETALSVYTELQCGSYVFMDAEYTVVDPDGSGNPLFPTSLFAMVRVISANHPGMATTDGGEKRFAAKKGTSPIIRKGAPSGATYAPTSDEHGTVTLQPGSMLDVGTLIELEVPHCDPTVNLYDFLHLMRGDQLIDIWPVDARGA